MTLEENKANEAQEIGPKRIRKTATPPWIKNLIVVLIVPTVIGWGGVYWAFFMEGPKVTVFYTYEEGYFTLPSRSRHFFLLLQRFHELVIQHQGSFEIPKENISKMRKTLESSPPLVEGTSNIDLLDDSIKLFCDLSTSVPHPYYSQVVRFNVANSGNRTAKEISIVPASAGHFEIWPTGNCYEPESQGYTRTKILIPSLQPGEQKQVTFWPDNPLDKNYLPVLTATHADGTASVEEFAVYRDGTNFIFQVQKSTLIILGSLITAFFIVFIFRHFFRDFSVE